MLELDSDRGAMLLEHLEPGTPLTAVGDDEEATTIAAGVMKKLWYPAPPNHGLSLVSDCARGFKRLRGRFGGGSDPMPTRLVEEAERLFDELPASQGEALVLHGDLHQVNILAARRQPWLAIDPKGVVGEATYDTATLLHNPVEALGTPDSGGSRSGAWTSSPRSSAWTAPESAGGDWRRRYSPPAGAWKTVVGCGARHCRSRSL